MYDSKTDERLDIFTPDGQPAGDAIGLSEVTILPAPPEAR
jgi:hypothetical protein